MKLINYTLLCLILIAFFLKSAAALEKNHTEYQKISKIIETFKTGNKNKIVTLIKYPLVRPYPVPKIKDEQEMMDRFAEIFDKALINSIINSDIKSDWNQVGWRGISFNGALWVDAGKIYVVNYRTDLEIKIANEIIQNKKVALHSSIKDFISPELEWDTKNYHIRVDKMNSNSFRYAVWKKDVPTSSKPDLVILNGIIEHEGTGGSHRYVFNNNRYSYLVNVIRMGREDSPSGRLQVLKGDKIILTEDVIKDSD